MKQDEARNTANGKASRDPGLAFGVQFSKPHLWLQLPRRRLKHRRHLSAGSAPGGPEIDQQGKVARARVAVEIGRGEFNRLAWEKDRAAPAARPLAKPHLRHPVRTRAGGAGDDKRIGKGTAHASSKQRPVSGSKAPAAASLQWRSPAATSLVMRVEIIAAPFHAGEENVRVGAGPHRLLADGIEDALRAAELSTEIRLIEPVHGCEGEIGRTFELKRQVAAAVAETRASGAFPLVLAGNCNTSVGVAAGVRDPEAGLVWFDAHPDFDTPNEHQSGYFDSMGVATLTGRCWQALAHSIPGFRPLPAQQILYCGIRDFEPGQLDRVEAAGIAAVLGSRTEQVDFPGKLLSALRCFPCRRAMIHLDADCLDPSVGTANEYAAPGGLTSPQLTQCIEALCKELVPLSLTIASFHPGLQGSERISASLISAAVIVAVAAAARTGSAQSGS